MSIETILSEYLPHARAVTLREIADRIRREALGADGATGETQRYERPKEGMRSNRD